MSWSYVTEIKKPRDSCPAAPEDGALALLDRITCVQGIMYQRHSGEGMGVLIFINLALRSGAPIVSLRLAINRLPLCEVALL